MKKLFFIIFCVLFFFNVRGQEKNIKYPYFESLKIDNNKWVWASNRYDINTAIDESVVVFIDFTSANYLSELTFSKMNIYITDFYYNKNNNKVNINGYIRDGIYGDNSEVFIIAGSPEIDLDTISVFPTVKVYGQLPTYANMTFFNSEIFHTNCIDNIYDSRYFNLEFIISEDTVIAFCSYSCFVELFYIGKLIIDFP